MRFESFVCYAFEAMRSNASISDLFLRSIESSISDTSYPRCVCYANASRLSVISENKFSSMPFRLSVAFSAFGQAFDRLVTVSSMCYHTSTSVLSTSCSSRGLRLATGDLILRGASRLDAFSVYPFRTWLLCHALGNTTDTPAVRPPRSSRTKGSSSQISCARAG